MRELELNQEYVYEYACQKKKGHYIHRETVTFRVIGKTDFAYTIKYATPKPSWLLDYIIFGSGMHLSSKLI